ncbi:MAG: Mur ligase domain-containing protein [Candidatus Saccharimonadales bacterium]
MSSLHIFFSGIGGTAIGPLALIAHQAGFTVSGSDKQESQYVDYLRQHGIQNIAIGQTTDNIQEIHGQTPIDWIVYSSAVAIENPDHPELVFARSNDIKLSKRDELLNKILQDTGKKLLAIAGTHGKTTTTAMAIWLFKQLDIPISYSVGAKIPFGEMGNFDAESEYLVYECDEFDRNFLAFYPYLSLITGIDYDHHEIFPTRNDYRNAFKQFLGQADQNIVWQSDVTENNLTLGDNYSVLSDEDAAIDLLKIVGHVNRRNAWQVIQGVHRLTGVPIKTLSANMESFPGLSRRFEKITDGLYTDYAHTTPKIQGCLQMAREVSDNVVVVYEPLTNRRQQYIRGDYANLFADVKKLYWVPSYLAREDPDQAILTPSDLITNMRNPEIAEPAELDNGLKGRITEHLRKGDLVVCLSGGGGGSLDEWLRTEFRQYI